MPPLVSVVIAAYNERAYIGRCLAALREQSYSPIEVLVVDDGSRDGTAGEATRFPEVRLITQAHRGAGAARNKGAGEATGEILVFLDADMMCSRNFVEALVAPMINEGASGTFTKEIFVGNNHRRWAVNHQLGRGLPADVHFPEGFPDRWENFRALWRADFLRVGGFDEVGHGEDVTLGRKLGQMAQSAPGAVCFHHEPETLADIFRSARWLGRGERITELNQPMAGYRPRRSISRAFRLALAHRRPSLVLYRLVWDLGVVYGWRTRRGASPGK